MRSSLAGFRIPSNFLIALLLLSTTGIYHSSYPCRTSVAELEQLRAAAFETCKAPKACGGNCVPHTGCNLVIAPIHCGAPTNLGSSGVQKPAPTIGYCGFTLNPFGTCPQDAKCGIDVIPSGCPTVDETGNCPNGTCLNAATFKYGC